MKGCANHSTRILLNGRGGDAGQSCERETPAPHQSTASWVGGVAVSAAGNPNKRFRSCEPGVLPDCALEQASPTVAADHLFAEHRVPSGYGPVRSTGPAAMAATNSPWSCILLLFAYIPTKHESVDRALNGTWRGGIAVHVETVEVREGGSHRRLQPFLQVVGACCNPPRMRWPGPFAGKAFTASGSRTPESALAPDFRPGSGALAPAASHIVSAPTLCKSGRFRKMRWAEGILGRMRYRGIRPSAFTGRPTIRAVWNSGWASLPLITQTSPSLACLSPSPAGVRRCTVHSPGEAS